MVKLLLAALVLAMCSTSYAEDAHKPKPMRKLNVRPKTKNENIVTLGVESNTYRDTVYLNPTVDFDLANGWDVQLASYNIPVYGGGAQNYEFDSYFNLSKTFELTKKVKAVLGTQNGTTLLTDVKQLHTVVFGQLQFYPVSDNNLMLRGGPYWANKALTITTDVLGYTTGIGFDLIRNTLSVQADYYSGHSNVSGATVNLMWTANKTFQTYVGVGVPERDSGNEFYGTFGINLSTGL